MKRRTCYSPVHDSTILEFYSNCLIVELHLSEPDTTNKEKVSVCVYVCFAEDGTGLEPVQTNDHTSTGHRPTHQESVNDIAQQRQRQNGEGQRGSAEEGKGGQSFAGLPKPNLDRTERASSCEYWG